MAVLKITEIANPCDGKTADITLDREPEGELSVFASRLPGEHGDEVVALSPLGGLGYRLTMPWQVDPDAGIELVYLDAHDAQGWSSYRDENGYLQGQAGFWLGTTLEDELTDVMKRLTERVRDNRVGIEARMRAIEPDITIKQIIWGMGEQITAYPAIEINQGRLREEYEGGNYFRLASVEAELYGYILHQVPTVEAELITAFGRALQKILNQETYEQVRLSGGKLLTRCRAEDLSFDNNIWNGQRFVSSFALTWAGEFGETIP